MNPFKNNKKKNLKNPPSQGSFGALFPNQRKKNPRAPNLMGHLDIDSELLEQLMSLYDGGESIRLQVSAWKKQASGTELPYLTIKAQLPFEAKRQSDNDDDPNSFQYLADL
jgi:hypothetical protein